MSEIYKRTRKVIVGGVASVVTATRWTIRYRDHLGVRRLKAGFVDRKATEQLAARLERDAERIRSGLLTAPESHASRQTLATLSDEWLATLADKSNSATHVQLYRFRLAATFAGCSFALARDLDAETVGKWLALKRKGERFSHQTSNHYRRTLLSFGAWLAAKGYVARNPLATIPLVKVDSHLVHPRRSIDLDAFRKLVATTLADTTRTRWGMDGERRSWLYTVAAYSGLRAGTLASLTPQSFDFARTPATVTGRAASMKTAKEIVIPLPGWLAGRLKVWVAGKPGNVRLFPGKWLSQGGPGKMLTRDLADAGIPNRDEAGDYFDFQSLRGLYATWLVQSGASISEVQKLLGHSTPAVTAKHYVRLKTDDLQKPVERLPVL